MQRNYLKVTSTAFERKRRRIDQHYKLDRKAYTAISGRRAQSIARQSTLKNSVEFQS